MESTLSSYNVLLWGFGHMNKVVIRYVLEKGHNIIGVIGRHNIGEEPFEVAGIKDAALKNKHKDLKIVNLQEAESFIKSSKEKIHICILATRSSLSDIEPSLTILGQNSIKVLTIAEEAFYPVYTSPKITETLDKLFKNNNSSFTGTGAQDVLWGLIPQVLMGSSHKILKIRGLIQYNICDYGKALWEAHGAGFTVEKFNETIGVSKDPAYNWNSNEWLASALGWKIKETTQKNLPITENKDVTTTLKDTYKAGLVLGMESLVTTVCENGIVIETSCIGKFYYDESHVDVTSWHFEGEPNSDLEIKSPATVEVTCASAVNRIRQVVESKKTGFLPSFELGMIPWK